MDNIILNLGPFNDCCDYLDEEAVSEYLSDFHGCHKKMHYYSSQLQYLFLDVTDTVFIPTFLLCYDAIDSDRAGIIRKVELKILGMIYSLVGIVGVKMNLNNITIPIRSAKIVEIDGTPRVIAEVGIAIFS